MPQHCGAQAAIPNGAGHFEIVDIFGLHCGICEDICSRERRWMTGIARLTKFSCEACLWGVVQVVRGCPGRLRNSFTLPLVVFGSVLFVFGVHWLVAV